MTSKIWRITQPIDDEILSDAMVYNYYDLLECSLCRCKLATPAASLELGLAWHSKVTNPRVVATMGYGFGIVIQKKYADILAEKFSGFNVLPIKEEEDSPDNETPPLSGFPDYLIRYPYTGPEFVGIIPTVSAWSDLDLSKWSYHSLCPECGHLGIKIVGKPVPGRCNIWYNVPKSQLKGADFFCMKDVSLLVFFARLRSRRRWNRSTMARFALKKRELFTTTPNRRLSRLLSSLGRSMHTRPKIPQQALPSPERKR